MTTGGLGGMLANVALLLLAASPPAPSSPGITFEPNGAVYLDDSVTIVVATLSPNDIVQVDGTNVDIAITGRIASTFYYQAIPKSVGEGSINIRIDSSQPGIPSKSTRHTFRVLPELVQGSADPAVVFRKLEAAKRPLVCAQTTVKPSRLYVGQGFEIQWDLLAVDSQFTPQAFRPPAEFQPAGAPLREETGQPTHARTAAGGLFIWRRAAGYFSAIASQPGVVHIPSFPLSGVSTNPQGQRITIRRWSNPVDVEVLPAPPSAARLPIGEFTMNCREGGSTGHWPVVLVEVKGTGTLEQAQPPGFELEPDIPILIDARENGSRDDMTWERQWVFELHSTARELELPPVYFEYFNTATGATARLSCVGQKVQALVSADEAWARRAALEQSSAAAAKQPKDSVRGSDADVELRPAAAVLALLGLLMAINAARK